MEKRKRIQRGAQITSRDSQHPPDRPRVPRRFPGASQSPPGASQMPPSSPLILNVSMVPSARFHPGFDCLTFLRSGNDSRNNCKMLSKMGFQWMHKCVKCEQIVKRIMKKEVPKHLHMKMTKQGETQTLQSMFFSSPVIHGIVVSTFQALLRM